MIVFNIFLSIYLFYIVAILCFVLYRTHISARTYALFNVGVLGLLVSVGVVLFHGVFFLEHTYFLCCEVTNLLYSHINISFTIGLTPVGLLFGFLVACIGCTTNLYTLNYFRYEADELNFLFWLNAFIGSMLTLVVATNFYTLFLGWELIGLTSFFLINFWSVRRGTLKSSFKAFSFNVVSDLLLLSALVCFYVVTGTTSCATFLYLVSWGAIINSTLLQVGGLCLVGCALIKSVQIGGHLWLPDSMEAPVPASSLIHSATLVSAGVFLLCKFQLVFLNLNWTYWLVLIGAVTTGYGGLVAAFQTDLKKLLAYSTMSHCGFLWVLASLGNLYITGCYLFLHGLFKASTFYCAGSYIRLFGSQDSRWMGWGAQLSFLDTLLFLICAINLSGLPLTFGFFYKYFFFKSFILFLNSYLIIGLLFIGMLSSLIYFFRVTFYVLFDQLKTIKLPTNFTLLSTKTYFIQTLKFTLPNHQVAVFGLFLLAFLTVKYMALLYTTEVLVVTYSVELLGVIHQFLYLEYLFKNYYIIFYSAYLGLGLILVVLFKRRHTFAVEALIGLVYSLLFIFLLI